MDQLPENSRWSDHRTPAEVAKLEWDRLSFWDEWWKEGSNSFEQPVTTIPVGPVRPFRGSRAQEISLKKKRQKGLTA